MIRALRRSNASPVCMPEPMLHTVQALGGVRAGLRPLLRQGFRLLLPHRHLPGDGKPVDPMFAVWLQIFFYSANMFAAIGHKRHLLVLLHPLRLQQLLQTFVAQLLLQPFAGGLQVMAHGLGMQRIAHRPYLLPQLHHWGQRDPGCPTGLQVP